jgi:hypothetical protein
MVCCVEQYCSGQYQSSQRWSERRLGCLAFSTVSSHIIYLLSLVGVNISQLTPSLCLRPIWEERPAIDGGRLRELGRRLDAEWWQIERARAEAGCGVAAATTRWLWRWR